MVIGGLYAGAPAKADCRFSLLSAFCLSPYCLLPFFLPSAFCRLPGGYFPSTIAILFPNCLFTNFDPCNHQWPILK